MEHQGQGAIQPDHPTRKFGRFLAAYREHLTRSEAARRSGLPETLWEEVETSRPSSADSADLIPASIVAAMCITVGADVATGLSLAGHRPELHSHLIERPHVFAPMARGVHTPTGPYIATPHLLCDWLDLEPTEAHLRMASVYRQLARSNWHMANRILENKPDQRDEYWSGFAAAIRAVAEQQAWAADQENARDSSSGGRGPA